MLRTQYVSLLALTIAAGLTMPHFAYAQAASADTKVSAATKDSATSVGEIVVTAQKRSEKLVDVPISVAHVSRAQLATAGIIDMSGLSQVVPGLRMDSAGTYSDPSIRGVSSASTGPGLAANVATYVDGFYRPDPIGNSLNFGDVSSVQVLKGPQGTLFGRNSTGGAILITTLDPTHNFHGAANISYGNYNTVTGSAYVTGGLTDNLAASLTFFGDRNDGYYHNIITGSREGDGGSYTGRVKFLFDPTKDISITLSYEHRYDNDPASWLFSPYQGRTDGALVPGTVLPSQPFQVANNDPALGQLSEDNIFLTGKFDFHWATLTSLTSYQRLHASPQGFDVDATYAALEAAYFPSDDRTVTQEFDLGSSTSDRFKWVTGFYFMDQRSSNALAIAAGGTGPTTLLNAVQTIDAYALFADATYRLVGPLYLTAGGRFHIDDLGVSFGLAPDFAQTTAHTSYNGFDPRVVLRYQISDRSNVYASFSQGSKSGAYNADGLSTTPVRPEKITAYEVGYKADGHNWDFETAAFWYDYTDLQVDAYDGATVILLNAAKARIYGFEGHFGGNITNELRLDLGAAFTHGTYESFPEAPHYIFNSTTGLAIVAQDATGNALERSPEFSGTIGLTYHREILSGNAEFSANYSYQSKVYFDFFEDMNQGGVGLLNLRAAWTEPKGNWTFALYGRNVTNETYIAAGVQESIAILQTFGTPATYGFEISTKF